MNINIPNFNEINIKTNLFDKEFISFVLIKYLFEGKNVKTIEQEYFNSNMVETGSLAYKVVESYGLIENDGNELNIGFYKGRNISDVCQKLLESNNQKAITLANGISNKNENSENELKELRYESIITGGNNEIYYGAPGCGKSQKVKSICEENNFIYERTTFYPDYTNGEFVGQVVPEIDKDKLIQYKIQPGYFTKMLFKALLNPDKKYCLIIEEINRGNASAIFGDIFQLLDRDKKGLSEYKIENDIISKYFQMNGYKIKEIRIPSNMWILATMNTSDQNVYTLDTAFKRRWNLKKIKNLFDSKIEYDNRLRKMLIPGSTNVSWEVFITKINEQIFAKNSYGINAEDKQIGKYFVSENELEKPNDNSSKNVEKAFAEKVLMYLWEDVTKLNHELWFNSKYKTFDDLLIGFEKENLKIFNDIFDFAEDTEDTNEK